MLSRCRSASHARSLWISATRSYHASPVCLAVGRDKFNWRPPSGFGHTAGSGRLRKRRFISTRWGRISAIKMPFAVPSGRFWREIFVGRAMWSLSMRRWKESGSLACTRRLIPIRWFFPLYANWVTQRGFLVDWLIDWMESWLIDLLIVPSIDWLIDQFSWKNVYFTGSHECLSQRTFHCTKYVAGGVSALSSTPGVWSGYFMRNGGKW